MSKDDNEEIIIDDSEFFERRKKLMDFVDKRNAEREKEKAGKK